MKKKSDFFVRSILPVLLTAVIIISSGAVMFLAIHSGIFGYGFTNKISEYDLPDESAVYYSNKAKSIKSLYPWTEYDEKNALPLNDEYLANTERDLTECISRLADCAIADDSFAACNFSEAKIQFYENSLHTVTYFDNIAAKLFSGGTATVRAAISEDGILSFEIDDPDSLKRSYSGEEVNSAYEMLKYEAWAMHDSYDFMYELMNTDNLVYSTDASGFIVKDRVIISSSDSIAGFLCEYSYAQSSLGLPYAGLEDVICNYISYGSPELTYYDGAIYIEWGDGTNYLTLKYSLATESITGMSINCFVESGELIVPDA